MKKRFLQKLLLGGAFSEGESEYSHPIIYLTWLLKPSTMGQKECRNYLFDPFRKRITHVRQPPMLFPTP
jgi:hypothetical protein